MAGYVPWYGKKREGLKRREEDLVRILGRGEGREAVERAAEGVRAARIRALGGIKGSGRTGTRIT
jgi:hypothetical protein